MRKLLLILCFATGAATAAPEPLQPDGVSFDYGHGNENTTLVRAALRFDFDKQWFNEGLWFVDGRLELAAGQWRGRDRAGSRLPDSLTSLMLTPVLRLQRRQPVVGQLIPYVEIGIGAGYLSETKLQDGSAGGRNFGCHLQFEDKLSLGVLAGADQRFEAALFAYHYSNARLCSANDGINFFGASLIYRF